MVQVNQQIYRMIYFLYQKFDKFDTKNYNLKIWAICRYFNFYLKFPIFPKLQLYTKI